jgi:luciferase-like monooxygenase
MRHAVNLPPFAPPETLVSLAIDAEQAGWDGVFFWDHMTWLPELRLHVHDPWVLLGAVAEQTERVLLGTMVTPLDEGLAVLDGLLRGPVDHDSDCQVNAGHHRLIDSIRWQLQYQQLPRTWRMSEFGT